MAVDQGKYVLKAMLASDKNVESVSGFKYCRITPNYILLYTNQKVNNSINMPDEGFSKMTDSDVAWLKDCVTMVAIEKGIANEERIRENNLRFIQAFERELQKESEKLSGKEGMDDAERNKTETTDTQS